MPSVECLHHGCRNKVAENSEWGYYCYQHRKYSPLYSEMVANQLTILTDAQRSPGISTPSGVEMYADLVNSHTPLDSDLALPMSRTVAQWNGNRDMTIPRESSSIRGTGHRDFAEMLVEQGVDRKRISTMRVRGMNRHVPGTNVIQRGDNLSHEVLILDQGQSTECAVDPSISMFAPVYDQERSVEDQLKSGETPYGESPWIGASTDYTDGDVIWWDHHEYGEWH